MGKFVQTAMDEMQEPLLDNGTYPLMIEDCKLAMNSDGTPRLGWGEAHPNAQKFNWIFSVEANDLDPDSEGRTIRETTPDSPGIAKQLYKYLNGLDVTAEDFDPDEVIGTRVYGAVGKGKSYGEPCNKVWEITLNKD